MTSSGYYQHETHEDVAPFKKKCDECKDPYPLDAVFFPANWMHDGLVCGKCFGGNVQDEIDELGIEEFIKRFNN